VYAALLFLLARLGPDRALRWALLALPVVMLAVRIALVLASFALSEPVADAPRLGARETIRMWRDECVAFFRFQWLIMVAGDREGGTLRKTDRDSTTPLVVLLHGIFCSGAIWKPVAARLADRIGTDVLTPTLPRVIASIDAQTADFSAWLGQIAASHPRRPIVVIAHSLGGLIARRYALQCANRSPLAALICIGTPHAGSKLAALSRTRIAQDIRPASPSLAMTSGPSAMPSLLNIHATHDNLVIPAASSRLAHARNVAIAGCGHMALVYSPRVFDVIVGAIESVASTALRPANFR
jgi:pimeloyl-ACP methyl ester carboxylesterase